eukprot:1020380-Rhodomonas_salina.1
MLRLSYGMAGTNIGCATTTRRVVVIYAPWVLVNKTRLPLLLSSRERVARGEGEGKGGEGGGKEKKGVTRVVAGQAAETVRDARG